jgi:4-aminobutyrate aminotransferase-like enzyme
MALASLDEMERVDLPAQAARSGEHVVSRLREVPGVRGVSGRGLMLGVHVDDALRAMREMGARGYLALPCGERGEALGFTPPLNTPLPLLDAAIDALAEVLR